MTPMIARLPLAALSIAVLLTSQPTKTPEGRDEASPSTQNEQPRYPPITITVPPKSPQELADERNSREQDRAIQREMLRFNRYLVGIGIIQAVAMLLGLIAVAASIKAANAARDSADIARQTLTVTQRAFLLSSKFISVPISRDDRLTGFQIIVRWKNTGHTPALEAKTGVHVIIADSDEPESFDFTEFDNDVAAITTPHIPVGPQGAAIGISPIIPIAELERLAEGTRKIFVAAKVVYRDILPGTPVRNTALCARLKIDDPDGWRKAKQPFGFSAHGPHNYSD